MTEDRLLWERYRNSRDSGAFEDLVKRYLNLVWATAFRITQDSELARDIAQTVFVEFARKASSLSSKTVLAGWFHRAACFASYHAVRANARRAAREKEAMQMQPSEPEKYSEELEALFPMLDEALARLGQTDRDAIALRFFRQQTFRTVGVALGISEAAAEKRVARALQKLRLYFRRRGSQASAGLLAAALSAAGAQAAPAGVATAIVASSAAAAVTASSASGALLSFVHQISMGFTAMKTQMIVTCLIVAGFTGTVLVQEKNIAALRQENASLAKNAAQLPRRNTSRLQIQEAEALASELDRLRAEHEDLLKLREEAARLKENQTAAGGLSQNKLSDAQAREAAAQARIGAIQAEHEAKAQAERIVNDLKQLGLAARIYATDHKDVLPTNFSQIQDIAQGLDFSGYEFVQHSRAVQETEPDKILLREKQPRRMPDGTWSRAYALVDGSVQQVASPTSDYREWEKKRLVTDADSPIGAVTVGAKP